MLLGPVRAETRGVSRSPRAAQAADYCPSAAFTVRLCGVEGAAQAEPVCLTLAWLASAVTATGAPRSVFVSGRSVAGVAWPALDNSHPAGGSPLTPRPRSPR